MTSDIISLYMGPKAINIMKIMKYVKKTPKTSLQISQATKIPIATTYRLISELQETNYLQSIPDTKLKLGRTTIKYCRGEKYEIIITADGAIGIFVACDICKEGFGVFFTYFIIFIILMALGPMYNEMISDVIFLSPYILDTHTQQELIQVVLENDLSACHV